MAAAPCVPLPPDDLRAEFKRRRGRWHDDWEAILAFSPAYLAAYLELSAYVADHGALSPRLRELIYVATNCSPTHMFERGVRNHAHEALAEGATRDELLAVAAIVSTVGGQTYAMGAAALAACSPVGAASPSAEADQARADHRALFGELQDDAEAAIALDAQFYQCWLNFAAAPLQGGVLPAREAHLIALAAYAQCTQLSREGVERQVRAALAAGASSQEVLDVFRLITSMSIHAMVFALPIINELAPERATV
jgi:alkylhydroperoxidase/carboxymuconolactone decarboxylase family protein YurZ